MMVEAILGLGSFSPFAVRYLSRFEIGMGRFLIISACGNFQR
jgi:hypothetical protein